MKSYGKKFLKGKMDDITQSRVETRDAVLWDVLPASRMCRVKIQGSDTLVVAHFPQSWDQTPSWMKPSNAVRITHMGGKRGRIEVVGCGQLIPTPVAGAATSPTPATPPDAVTLGGYVGVPDTPGMSVKVAASTYRIGGVTYSSPETTLALDPAPAVGQYRYDVIYGNTSNAVNVQTGAPAASNPAFPAIPSNTIQLGYVLVYGGMTEVTVVYTNREWTAPVPTTVTVTPTDPDLAWGETSTTVRVSVLDQYGNPITATTPGLYLTLEFQTVGNGTLNSAEEGDSPTKIGGHAGANNYYDFTYTRDGLATDVSPTLKGTCEGDHPVSGLTYILLRDANGNVMSGQDPSTYAVNTNLALFPEYPGALMTPSGSNNDPGTLGMTSDFEIISNVIYNYYQWLSDFGTLQNYDLNVKIQMPPNFVGFQVGTNVALTVGIKTEENTTTNNKIDLTLQKDGSATTSALTAQVSATAATWLTVGFDETDTVLAGLVAGDILNVTFRMYSQNSKYARIGKINLAIKVR